MFLFFELYYVDSGDITHHLIELRDRLGDQPPFFAYFRLFSTQNEAVCV